MIVGMTPTNVKKNLRGRWVSPWMRVLELPHSFESLPSFRDQESCGPGPDRIQWSEPTVELLLMSGRSEAVPKAAVP